MLYKCLFVSADTEAVDVSEHQHAVLTVDVLAPAAQLPQRLPHVFVRVHVVFAHDLLDGFQGLAGVVEGDSQYVVVENVGFDDVVEKVLADPAKLTVDGGASPSGKVPLVGFVVGHLGVRVLQVGNEHQPVVAQDVRDEPVDEHAPAAELLVPGVDDSGLQKHPDVQQHDVPVVARFEKHRVGVEVVGVELQLAGVFLARHVGEQVGDPPAQLLEHQLGKGEDGGVGDHFLDVGVAAGLQKLFLSLRHEHHVSGHVPGGLVVLRVGVFPREVRHHQV